MKSRGAWPDWIESEEGRRAADITTLPRDSNGSRYLDNRLWRAFTAGVEAGRKERAAQPVERKGESNG